ncbi:MAG: hypothetical protein HY360_15935 [Verrucomicrobia bacterium]|nr:hypothetical protein [Verrucomicrobiota bacterium]
MTTRASRLLVIDASVVQSAGETSHPVSSACRESLLAVLNICHRAAMTDAIQAEWNKHLSRFSRKWRRSMAAHQKPSERIKPTQVKVNTAGLSDANRTTIEKDLCLVEAAIAADRVIVTRDDAIQQALAKTREGKRLLETITWLNPVRDGIAGLKAL